LIIEKTKIFIHSKILCKLNRHDYVNDNAGISSRFTMNGMNYYHCRYCPQFIVVHPRPIPISYVKSLLKEKVLFEHNLCKKEVLFEKYKKKPIYENDGLLYIDYRYNEAQYHEEV
jgi:hypothetical protein